MDHNQSNLNTKPLGTSNNNSLNNSFLYKLNCRSSADSKILFSFSKSERWKEQKEPYNNNVVYNAVPLKHHRAAFFEKQKRHMTSWMGKGSAEDGPDPGQYEVPSGF